jgi:hypothetical protein
MVIVKYDLGIISLGRPWERENLAKLNSDGDGRNRDRSLVMVYRYKNPSIWDVLNSRLLSNSFEKRVSTLKHE